MVERAVDVLVAESPNERPVFRLVGLPVGESGWVPLVDGSDG